MVEQCQMAEITNGPSTTLSPVLSERKIEWKHLTGFGMLY
jgi:hypothetical protein